MRCCSGAATATKMRCRAGAATVTKLICRRLAAAAARFFLTRRGELWRDQSQGNTNTNEYSHGLHLCRLGLQQTR
jgi:hypothetical protein